MPGSYVFDKTVDFLEKSMDISTRRHNLISGNIANMNTVGYQPRDLDFRSALQRELSSDTDDLYRTHTNHYRQGVDSHLAGSVRKRNGNESSPDQVNIDTEMTHLVENNLKYRTSVEMLLRKIAILRHTISEGGQ